MDSIHALAKVYDSLSKGASMLDFPPSDITGDCAAQVQEIVREGKSGKMTEKVISSALSCMKNGNGLRYLGAISLGLGYWTYSLRAYEKALKAFEKLGDLQGAAHTCINLGSLHYRKGEWIKAIEFYQKSLETEKKIGNEQGVAYTYHYIGLIFAHMGERTKAIELYQKSLETKKKIGDEQGAALG